MIPVELRPAIGNRIFGCDDCLAVCPWNKFAQATHEPDFRPREALTAPRLAALAALDDAGFRRLFAGSPIKRTGYQRFLRNVLIAIGNAEPGDCALVEVARQHLDDSSPLVRAAAVWAFARMAPAELFAAERDRRLAAETEPLVAEEWRRDLAPGGNG
jgi:epoxyqueuosine reductase